MPEVLSCLKCLHTCCLVDVCLRLYHKSVYTCPIIINTCTHTEYINRHRMGQVITVNSFLLRHLRLSTWQSSVPPVKYRCNILDNISLYTEINQNSTHKHLEMHGCILSTLATDTLVLKHHQTISTHSVDQTYIAFSQFCRKVLHLW